MLARRVDANENNRQKAGKTLGQAMVAGLAASLFWFMLHSPVMAGIALGLGLLLALGSWVPQLAWLEKIGVGLAKGIGALLTGLLLLPVYYLIFSAGRLLYAFSKKDPLNRHWDLHRDSYWSDCDWDESRSYQKQY